MAFLIAGILFEAVFLMLKVKIHNLPLNIIIGTSIFTASLPLITAFLLSAGLANSFPVALINLVLLSFAVGVVVSLTTFLLWYNLEKTKWMIKLKYYLMS